MQGERQREKGNVAYIFTLKNVKKYSLISLPLFLCKLCKIRALLANDYVKITSKYSGLIVATRACLCQVWNGIWLDMMIETTFMKFGKGPTGIIGKTANLRTIQIWAKSQHKRSEVLHNLDELCCRDETNMKKHKENTRKIKNDQADCTKLTNFFKTCIVSLQSKSHTLASLCKIFTG